MQIFKSPWTRIFIVAAGIGLALGAIRLGRGTGKASGGATVGCGGAVDEEQAQPAARPQAPERGGAMGDNAWEPATQYAIFIRNNTTSKFHLSNISQSGTCGDRNFPNGTAEELAAGSTTKVVELTDGSASTCKGTTTTWTFTLYQDGCSSATNNFHIRANGSVSFSTTESSFATSNTTEDKTFCSSVKLSLYGRSAWYASGIYVTIGDDAYGGLGPSRSPLDPNKLTVTSFNTYLGTESKPERNERATAMKAALSALDTDVLVLEEMNLRDAASFDGLELAAYLHTGDAGNDTNLESSSYENGYYRRNEVVSSTGTDESPQKGGVFPYMSHFVSGLALGGDENETGGVVILSKWPLWVIENNTYHSDYRGSEQKGFLVVKVTKTVNSLSQDYYIAATHTEGSNSGWRSDQIDEMADYLDTTSEIPQGARVIIAGDLNTDDATQLAKLGITNEKQANTGYYLQSRDGNKNFYECCSEVKTIDWVLPSTSQHATRFFATPRESSWWVHPMRDTTFKFAELSDHFAVSATFTYGHHTLQVKHSGKFMDVEGQNLNDNAPLHQWTYLGQNNQKFTLAKTATQNGTGGDYYYNVVARHSGKCAGVLASSTAAGAKIVQSTCSGGDSQKFLLVAQSDGTYSLKAKHSGLCVDMPGFSQTNGTDFIQWACNGNDNQKFTLSLLNQ